MRIDNIFLLLGLETSCVKHVDPDDMLTDPIFNRAISLCGIRGIGTYELRNSHLTEKHYLFYIPYSSDTESSRIGTLECRVSSFTINFTNVTPTETCTGTYSRPKKMTCTRNNSDSEQKEGQ